MKVLLSRRMVMLVVGPAAPLGGSKVAPSIAKLSGVLRCGSRQRAGLRLALLAGLSQLTMRSDSGRRY